MSHSFQVIIPANTDAVYLVDEAKIKVKQAGGFLDGDCKSGEFGASGVEGRYSISGDIISITLYKKPFYISYPYIARKVEQYFT